MMQNIKPLQLIPFLFVLAGLASCTEKPNQSPAIPPTPQVSTAMPILAAPTPDVTQEVTTDSLDGSENAATCDGIVNIGTAEDGWMIYCSSELGYSFYYPADASLEVDPDHPLDGVSLIGPENNGERWPWIEIRHPQSQAEFNPPADVVLQQWLADHYLLGAPQRADVLVSGIRAIHLRFDRSQQSYAFDRFYFVRAGQLYMILIAHTGDREDWDLYNHFLESFTFEDNQ